MSILESAKREHIRYCLFAMRNGREPSDDPSKFPPWGIELWKPLKVWLSENGLDLQQYDTGEPGSWDIGIDDLHNIATRPAQWWCWGISHVVPVFMPSKVDGEPWGLRVILDSGFGRTATQTEIKEITFDREYLEAGVLFSVADYKMMLAGASTRKSWA